MKRYLLCIIAALFLATTASAQSKEAKKEAKSLAKQGFKVAAGLDPLVEQLDRTYEIIYDLNDKGEPKYITGFGIGVSSHYDEARTQALAAAKSTLAENLGTKVASTIETMTTNKQISATKAETMTKMMKSSSSVFMQSIRKTEVVLEYYRDTKDGDKEVMVSIVCEADAALQRAFEALDKTE